MEKAKYLDRKFEIITWGLLLIWWGLRWWPLASLPNGAGLVGTGLVLLGLNVIRSVSGVPVKGSTTVIGILTLVCGALLVTSKILQLSFQLPIFEIMLIGMGVFLLVRELLGNHKTRIRESR